MSVTLTLARAPDFDRLDRLVAAHHEEAGLDLATEQRTAALATLLEGVPQGVAYLIGPPKSPVGYTAIAFGWSVPEGGLIATVESLYIRPGVRRRGMATEALAALLPALARHGVRAVGLEIPADNSAARRLAERLTFSPAPPGQRLILRL